MWQETAVTLSAHSGPVLLCALIGFACADLAGWLVGTALTPQVSALSTAICRRYVDALPMLSGSVQLWHPALATFCLWEPLSLPMMARLLMGAIAWALVRGALTWLGLHRVFQARITLSRMCRVVLARWPALMSGSLVYGTVMALSVIGVDGLLGELGLAVSGSHRVDWVPVPSAYVPAVQREIGTAMLKLLIPDPGQPFDSWLAGQGAAIVPAAEPVTAACVDTAALVYELNRGSGGNLDLRKCKMTHTPAVGIAHILGLSILFMAEAMLRFRTVAALQPGAARRGRGLGGMTGWLLASAQVGSRHFGTVTVHSWLLRLAAAILAGLFVLLPSMLMNSRWLPLAVNALDLGAGVSWVYAAAGAAASLGSALISAWLAAFCAVYDARLYLALRGETQCIMDPVPGMRVNLRRAHS